MDSEYGTLTRKPGWGQSGTLTTGNPNKIVTMQYNPPEAQSMTLQFNISQPAGANNPVFAQALITWTVEGHQVTRRVTICDGVSVTGVAQSVRVQINDYTPTITTPDANVDYGVSCQVAPGVRASSSVPTWVPISATVNGVVTPGAGFWSTPAPGSVAIVDLPQDAGIVGAFVTIIGHGAVAEFGAQVIFVNNGIITTRSYDPRDACGWVPVPAGSTTVQLSNFSNVGGNPGAVVDFSIAFSIDG